MITDFKVKVNRQQSIEIQTLLKNLGGIEDVLSPLLNEEYLFYDDLSSPKLTWGTSISFFLDNPLPLYEYDILKNELLSLFGENITIPDFKIRNLNEEKSKRIQELVFGLGGTWRNGDTDINYAGERCLYYSQRDKLIRSLFETSFFEHSEPEYTFEQLTSLLGVLLTVRNSQDIDFRIESENNNDVMIPDFKIHVNPEESAEIQRLLIQLGVYWDRHRSIYPDREFLYYRNEDLTGLSWGNIRSWYETQQLPEYTFEILKEILNSLISRQEERNRVGLASARGFGTSDNTIIGAADNGPPLVIDNIVIDEASFIDGDYLNTIDRSSVQFVTDTAGNIQYSTFSSLPQPSKKAGEEDWGKDADNIISDLKRWLHY